MMSFKIYCDALSEILYQNDAGFTDNYQLCISIAETEAAFGNKKTNKAIQDKVNGKAIDFANGLIIKLMGYGCGHVDGCIKEFVQSYLYHKSTAAEFVESCIDCWRNSDRLIDNEFAEDEFKAWDNEFAHLGEILYRMEADKLAACMKS